MRQNLRQCGQAWGIKILRQEGLTFGLGGGRRQVLEEVRR